MNEKTVDALAKLTSRKGFLRSLGMIAGGSVVLARAGSAEAACASRCKCTRRNGCCRIYYVESSYGSCYKSHKDCSLQAKDSCNDCGGCP
jgi:hypothetical protein